MTSRMDGIRSTLGRCVSFTRSNRTSILKRGGSIACVQHEHRCTLLCRLVYKSETQNLFGIQIIREHAGSLHWLTICIMVGQIVTMRTFLALGLWFLLLVLCWPIALVMLIIFPFGWLILLPFKIVGFTLDLVFKLIGNIFLFPFRR